MAATGATGNGMGRSIAVTLPGEEADIVQCSPAGMVRPAVALEDPPRFRDMRSLPRCAERVRRTREAISRHERWLL